MHSHAFSQELHTQWGTLRTWLNTRAKELGFGEVRITDTDVSHAHPHLVEWLKEGRHGQMAYMERHKDLRADPSSLQAGAIRSICLTMPYLSEQSRLHEQYGQPELHEIDASSVEQLLQYEEKRLLESDQAMVSVYARGRDYHKVIRSRLQILAMELEEKLQAAFSELNHPLEYRVFTDSAPLMEVELARKAGLGWRGKHTLLLNRDSGSFFFLGEILINVPLPIDEPMEAHCGSCQACIDICPTNAIVAPYQLDARRCISYLTIEHRDAIPVEFRSTMGNRIYGCDDCQLVCPWNKYAQLSTVADFGERNGLGSASLLELWSWSEAQFIERHAGSAILRIGYERWRRNLAVALGNALASNLDDEVKREIVWHLQEALPSASPLVAEHISWALSRDGSRDPQGSSR
ncbi:tRNA epoxyqueuosine(34) reductase QueG [Polynucleobacter sp. HIN7]|uniref:tRNA epoxyqueuosine(34) reductase QueG n=1 Tax=Polynucleobacter sp. HIN7 TaxID=3047866 RepID=UPI002572410B|nr:tRNA epoxyqueuosine(34) reductase QueG [Polynucleobacter sp. HIN7]